MGQADWSEIADALSSPSVARGVVTSGVVTPPTGGDDFTYGMNSRAVVAGTVALFSVLADFAPTAYGGKITGALQRGVSGGVTGWAPYLFINLGGTSSADSAYMLGLADSNPSRIVLRKGALGLGLPDGAPGSNGILRRSSVTVAIGQWVQLRLDAILEPNGDVLLKVFSSDVALHSVASPVWTAVDGMDDFTDDALGVNTGSDPLSSGRMGFGMYVKDTARRAYFDELVTERQLPF